MREASADRLDRGRGTDQLSIARLTTLVVGVAAALVVVALAARSRPWSEGAELGTIPNGWLGVVEALVVLASPLVVGLFLFMVWEGWQWLRMERGRDDENPHVYEPPPTTLFEKLLVLLVAFLLISTVATGAVFAVRYLNAHGKPARPAQVTLPIPPSAGQQTPGAEPSGGPGVNWEVVAAGGAVLLLAGVAAAVFLRRQGRPPTPEPRPAVTDEVVAAIDESVDDLRADPDARRAVIRAYARMERAFSAHGLSRRPSEAPTEYLARMLVQLRGSGPAARRLTELFSRAKFSRHPVGPPMREEAIDALTALRAELETRS